METLHLRAQPSTIEKILDIINQFSSKGEEIEIVDNAIFDFEKRKILKSLEQEREDDTFGHEEVWAKLLK